MLESDAGDKWCPFARIVGWEAFRDEEKTASINRIPTKDGSIDSNVACLGSRCMAWRQEKHDIAVSEEGSQVAKIIKGEGPIKKDHGYCGLAGKP